MDEVSFTEKISTRNSTEEKDSQAPELSTQYRRDNGWDRTKHHTLIAWFQFTIEM